MPSPEASQASGVMGPGDTEGPRQEAGLQEAERERPWRTGVSRELGLPSRGPGKVTDFTQEGSSGGRERKGWLGLTKGRYRASQGCGKNGTGRTAAATAAPRMTGRVQGRTWFSHQGINIGTL